jgi:hypothetical protein
MLISGRLAFRSRRFSAIPAALCLCPSARPPPPIDVLLQTKGEVEFDSTVERLSMPFFLVQSVSNQARYRLLSIVIDWFLLASRQRVASSFQFWPKAKG